MVDDALATEVILEAEAILEASDSPLQERLQTLMQHLHTRLPHFHWVGIYWLKGDELTLGPYVGPPTEHVRIPVGRGVCGTAVAENMNQIIEDVRTVDNYLACNLETRSEIVVLIRHPVSGRILGQIDVDGTEVGAFDESDEALLEVIGERIAQQIVNSSPAEKSN
ncbi:MAG: GAF domain-containing protein [Fimbriimonadales bacterium]|nr:GAF domain-containing protein [Fimbriimonadales bacterium]